MTNGREIATGVESKGWAIKGKAMAEKRNVPRDHRRYLTRGSCTSDMSS